MGSGALFQISMYRGQQREGREWNGSREMSPFYFSTGVISKWKAGLKNPIFLLVNELWIPPFFLSKKEGEGTEREITRMLCPLMGFHTHHANKQWNIWSHMGIIYKSYLQKYSTTNLGLEERRGNRWVYLMCTYKFNGGSKGEREKWWLLLYLKSSEREREMWPAVDGDELQAVGSSSLLPTWFNQHLLPTCIAHNFSQLLSLTKIPIPMSAVGFYLLILARSGASSTSRTSICAPSPVQSKYHIIALVVILDKSSPYDSKRSSQLQSTNRKLWINSIDPRD